MIVVTGTDFALANLMDVVAQYGEVADVDDSTEQMSIVLASVAYRFVVKGGNEIGVERPIVMLTAVNGQAVFVRETAGSYVVDPRIAAHVSYRFAVYSTCVPCQAGTHGDCERQADSGRCRCLCTVDWAVHRARQALGVPADPRPTVVAAPVRAITAAGEAVEAELLPRRAELVGHCGCECQAGLPCGDCGHAGCAAR